MVEFSHLFFDDWFHKFLDILETDEYSNLLSALFASLSSVSVKLAETNWTCSGNR